MSHQQQQLLQVASGENQYYSEEIRKHKSYFFFSRKVPKHWFVFLNEARFSQIFWNSPKIVRDWFVFQRKSPKWVHFVPKWPWKVGESFKAWVTQTLTSPNKILWKLYLCGNFYLFSTILMNIRLACGDKTKQNRSHHMQKCLRWSFWHTPSVKTTQGVFTIHALWDLALGFFVLIEMVLNG